MFTNRKVLLDHLWQKQMQTLNDHDLKFRYDFRYGGPEFYEFGPKLIAVPIFDKSDERLELLCVGPDQTPEQVELAVKEMINMIKRKRLGPSARRIKL